ncbi:telomerase protein component 1-like [Amphiura filiformis]|uniref:telomerase protein component 1-like n=1 Tax=Amphiura filiformis TaxID=82378 RepID=UPI003B21CC65
MGCGSSQSLEGTVASSPTEFRSKANDVWSKAEKTTVEPQPYVEGTTVETEPLLKENKETGKAEEKIAKDKNGSTNQPSTTNIFKPAQVNKYNMYNVSEVWSEVDVTMENDGSIKKERRKQIVVKRSGWKTIRVFVSSTFKDFHAEQEVLVKEVFPDLREWCQKRRLHLVDCDLRWGVPKDTTSGETLRLCLGEIDRCYQDNIMPFFLNLTSERCGWIPTFNDVPESIVSEYKWVHGLSVTEMEIMHGAYRIDNPNALFMIRSQSFLKSVPKEHKDDFIDPNPVAVHKLTLLKERLKDRLDDRVSWYDCEFDGINEDGKLEFKGLQENLGKQVFEFFKERIEAQYPLEEVSSDPNQVIREAHESFMKIRGETVLGRSAILDRINNYISEIGVDYPLVVLGGPGSGKSAILARIADVTSTLAAQKKIPGGGSNGWHVFYHFVGAVPGSTDLQDCLKRLLIEIDAVNEANMPKDLDNFCQTTSSKLSHAKTNPVIVIIDALNQFDDDTAATILKWLPRRLAPQVRVIISMIHETPPHKSLKERGYSVKELMVTPLDMSTRREIVSEMLRQYNKQLDNQQMNNLLGKQASQNPLWLSIACEELRVYGVYEKVTDKINRLADGLIELIHQVFDRFEEENGGQLLVATICLLETSSTGLLETELLKILAHEDNLMPSNKSGGLFKFMSDTNKSEKEGKFQETLPAAKWATVYRALRAFIRPFGDSGEGRLDFYHRAVSKAVRKKYLPKDSDKMWWHKKLAEYFFTVPNVERKVEELPPHLIFIKDTTKLKATLTDWGVFDLLYNEHNSAMLLKYWREGFNDKDWQLRLKDAYQEAIENGKSTMTDDVISHRYDQIARVLVQAGQYDDAYAYLEKAIQLEVEKLGNRPERLVEFHDIAALVFEQKLKLVHFVTQSAEEKYLCKQAIKHAHDSINLRKTLSGDFHKYKLAHSLTRNTMTLNDVYERKGHDGLTAQEALEEAQDSIKEAIEIFTMLGDDGMLAEAIMTGGVLEGRGTEGQIKSYEKALELCLQAYGEFSILATRLLLNIGIYHEDNRRYTQACEYFVKWHETALEVHGYHHPKTQRARETLEEPRYKVMAAKMLQERRLAKKLEQELGSSQW